MFPRLIAISVWSRAPWLRDDAAFDFGVTVQNGSDPELPLRRLPLRLVVLVSQQLSEIQRLGVSRSANMRRQTFFMVAVLQQVGGGRIIAIDRAVVLVGRGADCDVVITASAKISRRHCCLVQVDKDYYLRDLGSMNGVWLNGARVNRESVMRSGDRVTIGDVEFLFHPNARIEPKKTVITPAAQPSAAAPAAQVARPNLAPQSKPVPRPTQGTAAAQVTAATQTRPVAEAAAAANSKPAHPASVKPVAGRSAAAGNNGSKNSRRLADRPQVFQANEDVFEIIDDVIPLDESGIPMIGTNELEIIDELIIDEDDLDRNV